MVIAFEKISDESKILNPMNDFVPEVSTIEHRLDPLTKQSAFLATTVIEKGFRLGANADDRFLNEIIEKSKTNCFFCPENLERATPKFPPEILPEGRLYGTEACLFPNLLAISKFTSVVTLTKRHYLRLDEYDPEILSDAFILALQFIKRVHKIDPSAKYVSIGCNCLYPAGSSIVHPHIHAFINSSPFDNYAELLLNCSKQYFTENSTNYWTDLVEAEKKEGQRYIGNIGSTDWLTSFAPSASREIQAIVRGKSSFIEFTEDNMRDLAQGISKVLNYYHNQKVNSFNFIIHSSPMGESTDYFSSNLRIVSRTYFPPYNVNDTNWRQLLMNRCEVYTDDPETIANVLQKAFLHK